MYILFVSNMSNVVFAREENRQIEGVMDVG